MNDKLETGRQFCMSLGSRVDFYKSDLTITDLQNDGKTPETRESLMMSVMEVRHPNNLAKGMQAWGQGQMTLEHTQ